MKKIILITLVITITLSCKAQIIPVEQHNAYIENGI